MGEDLTDLVLVVDDSPETLGLLNDALERSGMTTLVALDGQQALNIARKMTPDIILMDALMPGMDGFSSCQAIKRERGLRQVPVIFMTGLSDTDHIVRGFEAGGVDYVTKPINPTELIARIKVHLSNARATIGAQTALDTAGQNICAVNIEGELLWATPQVYSLLEAAAPGGWQARTFTDPIRQWLLRTPAEGAGLKLQPLKIPLKLTRIGHSQQNEILLRVINEIQPDETTFLRQNFPITAREADVFLWVAKGKTNREIAQILEMSPRTVNKHLEQLYKKLGVENRTSAAAMAVRILQNQSPF